MTTSTTDKKKKDLAQKLLDECDRPSCDDMVGMMKQVMKRSHEKQKVECPPTSPELGRSTWTLLHTLAAWYPEEPNHREEVQVRDFFNALARFYPCTWCARDFQTNSTRNPVQTKSRKDLCQWVCVQHNYVNEKLGKPLFPCDMETLDERWRKSKKEECQS